MGFVAADYHDYSGIPHDFVVPPPRSGDTGIYEYDLSRSFFAPGFEPVGRMLLFFQWLEPAQIQDAHGNEVHVNRLAIRHDQLDTPGQSPDSPPRTLYSEVGTQRYLGFADQSSFPHKERREPLNQPVYEYRPRIHTQLHDLSSNFTFYGQIPCGLENALQGVETNIHRRIGLVRNCDYPGQHQANVGGTQMFRPVSLQRVGRTDFVVFAREGIEPPLNLWFQRDIPYPVWIFVEQPDSGEIHSIRLASFVRGTAELPRRPTEGAPPAPPLALAAPTALGPDFSGTEVAFPFKSAYDHAAMHKGSVLEEFLARSPNALVEAAQYAERTVDGAVSRKWWFSVSNGMQRHLVGVVRDEPSPNDPARLVPVVGASARLRYDNSTDHDQLASLNAPYSVRATADDLPPRMPTFASVAAAWKARHGPEAPAPNFWGFSLRSIGVESPLFAQVSVGRSSYTEAGQPPPSQVRTSERAFDVITVPLYPAGTPSGLQTDVFPGPLGLATISASYEPPKGTIAAIVFDADPVTTWRMPYGPFLVLVVFVALLAVAATWWRRTRGAKSV